MLLHENEKLRLQVSQLQDSLLWLRKKVFGKMSEKHLYIDPNQLSLVSDGVLASLGPEAKAESKMAEKIITKSVKVVTRPARRQLDLEDLPVETEDFCPEGTLDANGNLKEEYVVIGTETSNCLERMPGKHLKLDLPIIFFANIKFRKYGERKENVPNVCGVYPIWRGVRGTARRQLEHAVSVQRQRA